MRYARNDDKKWPATTEKQFNFQRPKDSPKNPSPIMIRTVPKNRSRPLHFIPVPPLRKGILQLDSIYVSVNSHA